MYLMGGPGGGGFLSGLDISDTRREESARGGREISRVELESSSWGSLEKEGAKW